MSSSFKKVAKPMAFALPVAFLITFSIHKLDYFGLDFDELLFVNAALGDIDGATFISAKWHGLVLMVFPYIGALKSWIYYPIFKFFEVNPWSVRIPVVLILYFNIFLSYRITRAYFDKYLAYAVFLILSVDLTFITLHRLDKGPSALETLIKLLIVLLIIQPETIRKKILLFALALIGIFNKINFIWFANAIYGSFFIMYFFQIQEVMSGKMSFRSFLNSLFFRYSVLYFFVLVGYVLFIRIIQIYPSAPPGPGQLIGSVLYQLKLVKYAVINTRIFYLFGWKLESGFLQTIGNVILPVTILTNIWLYFRRRVNFRSFHTAFGLYCLFVFSQLVVTPNASNAWHTFVLFPFLQIFILNTFYLSLKNSVGYRRQVWYSLVGLWVACNLYTQFSFFHKVEKECVVGELFTPEMTQLIKYTQQRPEKVIISPVWGVHPPLLVTDKKSKKYFQTILFDTFHGHEIWYNDHADVLKNADDILVINCVLKKTEQFGNYYVVKDNILFNLLGRFLKTKNQTLYLSAVIKNKCGNPVYNIYKLKQLPHPDTNLTSIQ
jgi:hypothetical protein